MFSPDRQTRDTLWTLIATPTIWSLHFLLCYVLAAVGCAPNAEIFETIGSVRAAIGILTAIALAAIAIVGARAFYEWRVNAGSFPHADDTPDDRERFLEFSSVLLASLSFVAVAFVALPALVIVDCR